MSTTRGMPEPEPTRTQRVEHVTREVIAGHPQGAVRRIILYNVLGASMVLTLFGLTPAIVVGMVAFVLLIATDTL